MTLHKGTLLVGLLFTTLGFAFVLEALDLWTVRLADLRLIAPIALVIIGGSIIIGSLDSNKKD